MPLPRNIRQFEIIPQEELERVAAVIVGCGAIGSWLARFLAHMGVPCLLLVDHDWVSNENLALQGYGEQDLGMHKVEALHRIVSGINSTADVIPLPFRFRKDLLRHIPEIYPHLAVFTCLDSIETRHFVYRAVRNRCSLFVDGRMSAFVWRVITVDSWPDDYYETTVFRGAEANVTRCTAKGTVGVAADPANKMMVQLMLWLRGARTGDGTLACDLEFNQLMMTCEARFNDSR